MDNSISILKPSNSFQISTDSDIISVDFNKELNKKPLKSKNPQLKTKNVGHWNQLEKELYYVFLKAHRQNFLKKELRRTDKIFKEMAKFIKTRAADQCRSHHQKMQKKFSTFDEILEELQQLCRGKDCQQMMKTYLCEQTKHNSVYFPSTPQTTETDAPVIETFCDLFVQSGVVVSENVDQLQMGIMANGLFCDQVSNIDNYFLM